MVILEKRPRSDVRHRPEVLPEVLPGVHPMRRPMPKTQHLRQQQGPHQSPDHPEAWGRRTTTRLRARWLHRPNGNKARSDHC